MSGSRGKLHQAGKTKDSPAQGAGAADAKDGKKDARKKSSEVGRALRTVYDNTLREDIPDDFMDLLGKLS